MWIWKTEIIETPMEDQIEFTRRIRLVVEHLISLHKSFRIDDILRDLWERNLNLRDLRVENKRDNISEITSDLVRMNEDYSEVFNDKTKEFEWLYEPRPKLVPDRKKGKPHHLPSPLKRFASKRKNRYYGGS